MQKVVLSGTNLVNILPSVVRPKKEDINKSLFIQNPLNPSFKARPMKDGKIIVLDVETIIKMSNKKVDTNIPKVNTCGWKKNDGNICNAKLKWGNCYCLRHMKIFEKSKENVMVH